MALAQDAALEQRDLGLKCGQPTAPICEAALDAAAPLQREVGLIDIRAPAPRAARLTVGNRALHQHGARAKAHGEPTCTGVERRSAHCHSLRDLWAEGGREGHCTTPRARAGRCSTRGCPPPPPSRSTVFHGSPPPHWSVATESRTLAPSMTSALPAPSTSTPPACVALPLTTCTRRSKSLPPSMTSMALDICGTSHERECGPRQRAEEEQRQRCAPPRRRGSPPRRPRRGSRRRRSQRAASRRAGTRRTGGARASPRPRSR